MRGALQYGTKFFLLIIFSVIGYSSFSQTDYALSFDGINDYISIPNGVSATFTLEARIKTTATSTTGSSAWQGNALFSADISGGANDYIFSVLNNKLAFDDGSSSTITTVGTTNINDGNWHHVAVVRTAGSPGTVKLYIDGVQNGTTGVAGSAALTDNATLFIGGGINYFTGYMDEIRVWNSARTTTEINTYKNSTLVGNETNLYKFLNLNDGTGSVANNLVAGQTYGTLTNMTTTAATSTTATSGWVFVNCAGLWSGATSTNWATASNWCSGVVPTSTTDVVIPAVAKQPTISSSVNCKSLTINTGATLITSAAGTLNITGSITNSGTMTNSGSTNFNGTTAQTFTGVTTFKNLTLNNTAGLTLGGSVTVSGILTITAGTLASNNYNLTLSGNLVNNGGFTAGTATVTFNGTTIISGTTVTNTFNNLTLAASSTVTSSTGITGLVVNGTLTTGASSTLDLGTTTVLSGTLSSISNSGNIKTSVPTTTSATPIPSGKTWGGTIYYNAAAGAQTIVGGTYNIIRFSNTSGTNTASGDLTVNNQFITTAGGTLDMGSLYRIINMSSTITNNGTVKTSVLTSTSSTPFATGKTWGGTGTVEYGATTGVQTIVSGTYNNLKLDNTSGTNTIGGNITLNGVLTLSGGTVTTGAFVISLNAGASLSRSSGGHVIGNLKKNVATGATSVTFEIGDATNYTPATVAFASVTTAQYLTATVTATDHPNLSGSGIRTDKSVNRYWTFTNAGIAFTTATLTLNWVAGDVDAGSTTSSFITGNYSASAWTLPTTASPLATSIQATGLTAIAGDYAAGMLCVLSSGFSYPGSPYCSNAGTATPTIIGIAGTFTSTAGLSINSTTGAVNLSLSTPGTYTVTNSASSTGGCTSSSTASITVSAAPTVSGTSTETCVGGSTGTLTASASGGSTPYTYNLNGGSYQASNLFSGLAAGTYTLGVQSNAGCITTTSVTVSPYANSTDDQNATGSDTWIGHMYDGINFTSYIGQFTEAETFNETFGGDYTCFNVVSGGVTRSIYTETFSLKYKMNSTRKGLYVVDLGSDDGSRLTVDGSMVYNNWADQGFATKSSVLMNLNGASSLLYEFYESGGGNQVIFQNITQVLANNLSTNTTQTICIGNTGSSISGDVYGTLPTGITLSGTGYQWSYSTTPGGARTNITGATAATFTPSATVAPFTTAGTYYLYRNAVLSSTNNISPNPYVATNESNASTITILALPSATISYAGTPYCSSAGTATVTRTGTAGGTYSSTAGLVINSSTGDITISSSTAGTYTVTYTMVNGACTTTATTSVTLVGVISGNSLNYTNVTNGVLCATPNENGTATLTAPAGSVFTTVGFASYGTPSGSCSAFVVGGCNAGTSQSVAESYLLGNNVANIPATNTVFGDPCSGTVKKLYVQATYSQPVCLGTSPGTITGTTPTGGTGTYTYYWEVSITSSSAGFSAASGTNNARDYTAGTLIQTTWYRRTITSGACSSVSAVIQVTVSAVGSATISYSGTPYCSSAGTATVTRTGTAGGTYSSTTGLVINSSTGDITLASSTAGNYTVTYTMVSGSCTTTATTSVTITTQPFASGTYPATPYCSNAGTAIPTGSVAGAVGTFSSAAGLSLDIYYGNVNLSASTPGSYSVTYTVPASGGCGVYTSSTPITITAAPSATISYSGNPFCSNAGTASVTRTGTAGGTYTASPAGLTINSTTGNITLVSSSSGTYTITYTVGSASGCAPYITTASVTITINGTWTGAVSTNWNTAGNWACSIIPGSTTNVIIPGGITNYPTISTGSNPINNLTIQSGASLIANGATLQIAGTISNSGTFTASSGIVELNGSAVQTIPSTTFAGNVVKALTINNTAGVTLGGSLGINDALTISAGSLNTGGYLTLKSNSTATARIAPITSAAATPINGSVIVERYVIGRRKYRLISSGVSTSASTTLSAGQEALSIWGSWQNQGNNTTANSGTIITGGTSTDGFDQQTTNASLYTYDDVNHKYLGFTSARGKNTKLTPLKAGVAYYMFVYGDRLNNVSTSSPNYTVLSASGTILTGDQTYNIASTMPLTNTVGNYTMLGNPFASPIDWVSVTKTNLYNTFWGWDPNLSSTGGYVTVSTAGSVTLISPFTGSTGLNQYIQSGQGFFVRTSAASPVLVIKESDKVSNNNTIAFRSTTNSIPLMAVNLFDNNTNTFEDGAIAAFDNNFSNDVGKEDASKIFGSAEGLSIGEGSELLSIDARQMPQTTDTIFLKTSKLTKPEYALQIFANAMANSNVQPYLLDAYLKTSQALSLTDTNKIIFKINADQSSFSVDRFRIVFQSSGSLPLVNTIKPELKVFPNPVTDQQINFQLNDLEKGRYTITLNNSFYQKVLSKSIDHQGGNLNQTLFTGKKLSTGIYFLSIINKNNHYAQRILIE